MRASIAALHGRLDSRIEPLGHRLLRVVSGGFLVAHGWPKWAAGAETFAGGLTRRGTGPALPLAWMVVSLEAISGLLIALGLLIRPIAFLAAGHLAFIAFWVVLPNGSAWTRGGWEHPAMWGAVMLAIALLGGGQWWLDRLLFRR